MVLFGSVGTKSAASYKMEKVISQNNVVALAKSAKVFDVPVVLTTVETKSFSGNLWPQIRAVFPNQAPIERSTMNSWDDKNFGAAIKKIGKISAAGANDGVQRDKRGNPTGLKEMSSPCLLTPNRR